MLIDSHCHLDYAGLREDLAGVLARAKTAGVGCLLTVATTMRELDGVRVAAEHENVFYSVGVHPHHAHEDTEQVSADDLVRHADHPKMIAFGETGLDYHYDLAPREVQQQRFRDHLVAARRVGLPVIVHSREAEADTAKILRESYEGTGAHPLTSVLHCFSSKRVLAEDALAMGFYISVSGIITFKRSEELRAIVRDVPMDRLLLETDAPFLAPEPYRGKTCEPAHLVRTAEVLATLKGVSMETLAAQTTENFFRLFSKARVS